MTTLEVYLFVAPAIITTICVLAAWWQSKH